MEISRSSPTACRRMSNARRDLQRPHGKAQAHRHRAADPLRRPGEHAGQLVRRQVQPAVARDERHRFDISRHRLHRAEKHLLPRVAEQPHRVAEGKALLWKIAVGRRREQHRRERRRRVAAALFQRHALRRRVEQYPVCIQLHSTSTFPTGNFRGSVTPFFFAISRQRVPSPYSSQAMAQSVSPRSAPHRLRPLPARTQIYTRAASASA